MVSIKDIVTDTYTNASGFCLYTVMKPLFDSNTKVELSFDGITATSLSFLNSSFGALIEDFGIEKFISLVKPINITKSEAELIKKYISGFKLSSKA